MPVLGGRVRIPSVAEWRKRRDQAGELLYIIAGIPRGSLREEAWRIYEDWQEERISFGEAKRRLEELMRRRAKEIDE